MIEPNSGRQLPIKLNRLREGTDPLLLVDFARFSDKNTVTGLLSSAYPGDHAIDRLDVVTDLRTALVGHRLADVAGQHAQFLADNHRIPVAVIGYCSAATLAVEIHRNVAAARDVTPPALVLVEPTWIDPAAILGDLESVRATLGATSDWTAPLTYAAVISGLRSDVIAHLRRDGLPDDEIDLCADVLVERYEAWFGFLFATLAHRPAAPASRASIVRGQDSRTGPEPGWGEGDAAIVTARANVADLLADTDTARLLDDLTRQVRAA